MNYTYKSGHWLLATIIIGPIQRDLDIYRIKIPGYMWLLYKDDDDEINFLDMVGQIE